jgi:hypothetical protein
MSRARASGHEAETPRADGDAGEAQSVRNHHGGHRSREIQTSLD